MLNIICGLLASFELPAVILAETSESLETSTYLTFDCLNKFGAFNSTLLVFDYLLGALVADSLLVKLNEIARWRLFCSSCCCYVSNTGIALYMQLVAQLNFASI